MRFGLNYTPRTGWFHSWLDMDLDQVARDLEQIADLGVDHIRIFPLWPVLQPDRGLVRPRALADVGAVVDIAARVGLEVSVDVIQGHLSSFDYLPAWLHTWHRRNLFTDPAVIGGQVILVRLLAEELSDRPNLMGLTLGNELNQFAAPPHPDPHPVSSEGASAWLTDLLAAARTGLGCRSDAWVTHAMYDAAWYDDRQPFRPEHASEHGDLTVVHSWVFNGAAQLAGSLGAGSVRHAEYLLQLARAFDPDPGRSSWLQEVGSPTNVVPPADGPQFVTETVRNAMRVPGLAAITWWCSHDVPSGLLDFPPLEYDLGLFDADGTLKPIGRRFAELIAHAGAETSDASSPTPSPAGLVLLTDVDNWRSSCGPGGSFATRWLELADHLGGSPQVVTSTRADDPAFLHARGIDQLFHDTGYDASRSRIAVEHPATVG